MLEVIIVSHVCTDAGCPISRSRQHCTRSARGAARTCAPLLRVPSGLIKTLEMEMNNQPQMQQCVTHSGHAVAFIFHCHDYMFLFFVFFHYVNSLLEFGFVLFEISWSRCCILSGWFPVNGQQKIVLICFVLIPEKCFFNGLVSMPTAIIL